MSEIISGQAARIIDKFGGARRLAPFLGLVPSAVYRWTHPRSKNGTGGLIPAPHVHAVLRAADLLGITLTPEDWAP